MAEGITLIDVSVEPTKEINEVIQGAYEAVKVGLDKAGAKKLHGFRVLGENRFLVVASGDVDEAVWEMNERYGDKVRLTSTPMRPYAEFVEKTLGIKSDVPLPKFKDISSGGNIYWQSIHIEYDGMSLDSLMDCWRKEILEGPALLKGMEFIAYKTIFRKDAHVFVKSSPHAADNMAFTQPMWKEMGNKITSVGKPLKHMS